MTSPHATVAGVSQRRRLAGLLRYALRYGWGWGAIVFITLASSAAAVLQPLPMKVLVDNVLAKHPLDATTARLVDALPGAESSPAALVAWIALATLVLFSIGSVFEVVLTLLWTRIGQGMVYALAGDLFALLQRRSLLFHTRSSVGDLMARVTGDSWCVHSLVDTLVFAPFYAVLTIGGMLFLMVSMSPSLTVVAVVLVPLMTVTSLVLGRRVRATAGEERRLEAEIQSQLQQTLTGIPVVQAFAQEDREHARFRNFADAAVRAVRRSTIATNWASLGSGVVSTAGKALVMWVGARQVLRGEFTVGSLLVFLAYLATLQTQLKTLVRIPTALHKARVAVDRVSEVLEAEPEVRDLPGATPIEQVRGHVRVDGVTFGYEPDRPVLRGVSLEALPGQTVAVVGPTGAGKTTLVGLIARFFDPWEGRVTLDGRDLRDVTVTSLRSQVALVLQEPFLFPASVAENIAYGRPDATRADVEAAAQAANAHEFIARLPEGYDTVLGERGATLSGGQRQRLSIARALLKDAPVLILDEPTSALDADTEGHLMQALRRLMRGRTTFIVAHRFSTIRRADRIVVLDAGRVVESGTHEQLLSRGGRYARLYELQSGAPAGAPDDARDGVLT